MTELTGLTCLVLGGGGFIGINLCSALTKLGADVRVFGRWSIYPNALQGIIWHKGEFSDRLALTRAIEGADIIFHLISGSLPESSNRDPIADLASSAIPSLHLLESCRNSNVRKIIFVSSGGTVYGPGAPVPTLESAGTDPVSAYGVSKLAIEKYFGLYHYLYQIEYSILRVSNPYGPFQNPDRRQGVIAALLTRVLLKQDLEIWGDGEIVRDFVHVNDVVEAIISVASYNGCCKLFNVGSGIGRSINQVVSDILRVMQAPDIKVNYRAGRPTDVPVSVLNIGLIGHELGWTPRTDWIDGLQMTANWIRDQPFSRA